MVLQVLLRSVHEDLVLQYLKKLMKSSKKSTEQQVIGAQQMKDDAGMINEFFKDGVRQHTAHSRYQVLTSPRSDTVLWPQDYSATQWLSDVMVCVSEVMCLQDPNAVQLEMISLSRKFPDIRC